MECITTDIGSRIRQAREQRGLTLRDIANTTKISTAALNAIEHNDFARLPGGVFSRAYLRAFATEVGLDADELTREYRARFETEIPAGPLPRPRTNWFDRVRPFYRLPTILVTVGILIGSVITNGNLGSLSVEPARAIPARGAVTQISSGSVGRGVVPSLVSA